MSLASKLRKTTRLVRNLATTGVSPRIWWASSRLALEATHQHKAFQKPSEFAALVALVSSRRPQRVLEIGTSRGGTLWAWCRTAADDAAIVSVDLPDGPFSLGNYDPDLVRTFAGTRQQLTLIAGNSHDERIREEVQGALGGPIDFLFIDGDHTYDGARADFELYAPLVRSGGLVALHDIIEHVEEPDCEVDRVWREVSSGRRSAEFLDPADDRGWGPWGGIGVIWMP